MGDRGLAGVRQSTHKLDPYHKMEEELALVEAEIRELEGMLTVGLYKVPDPLYLQPSDLPSFHEQNAKHALFEPRLKAHLSKTFAARHKQEQVNRHAYKKQYDIWLDGITKLEVENGEKHLFEEEAPKHNHSVSLLQQTNTNAFVGGGSRSRSRSAQALSGDVVRSEEELNQVLLSLIEAERENPATRWMSTLAVIPPMIAAEPTALQSATFTDDNTCTTTAHLVMPTVEQMTEDGRAWSCVWREEDERVFVEKYLLYPKNFSKIASFLPADKHRGDCVQFYYRNKKRLKLKQRLQSHRRNPQYQVQMESVPVKKKVGRPPRAQSLFIQPTINEEDEMAIMSDNDLNHLD